MELAIIIAGALVKYGPALAEEIALLLHSQTPPTLEQWQSIFAKCKSLDQYVDEAKAAAGSTQ